MDIVFVAAGLGLLLVGGEWLVSGAVRLATAWRLSPAVIGLTIVGFGTSTPELLTSLSAAFADAPGIAIGNVVGSNIANILLILGLTALIAAVPVSQSVWRRDGMIMLGVTLALVLALLNKSLTMPMGLVAVLALLVYLRASLSDNSDTSDIEDLSQLPPNRGRAVLLFLVGLSGLLAGAQLLVTGAIGIAQGLGVSETIIGLSIVAVGTSLPELATSIIAARRGQADVAVGNIVGSNIFNILGILGITALVTPLPIPAEVIERDAAIMTVAALLFLALGRSGWQISRVEGSFLLGLYGLYIGWLTLS